MSGWKVPKGTGWEGHKAARRDEDRRKRRSQANRVRKRARARAKRKAERLPDATLDWLRTEPDPGKAGAILVGERPADPVVEIAERKIILP